MCEHTATVRGMSRRDRSGNERRSARRQGGAESELPSCRQFRRRLPIWIGNGPELRRSIVCGRQFESNLSAEWREGQALDGRFVLGILDDGARIGGAFILVRFCRLGRLGMRAAGKEFKAIAGFKQETMRRRRQPEDCQQQR